MRPHPSLKTPYVVNACWEKDRHFIRDVGTGKVPSLVNLLLILL